MKGSEFRAARAAIAAQAAADYAANQAAGDSCRAPVEQWYAAAVEATKQPGYNGPTLQELEAERQARERPCNDTQQAADASVTARRDADMAALRKEAYDSGGMSNDLIIADSGLTELAQDVFQQRTQQTAGSSAAGLVRPPTYVDDFTELETRLRQDHHTEVLWLIVQTVDGLVRLGTESRSMTGLATLGGTLLRVEELLWVKGTATGATPGDVDAFGTSALLLPGAVVRTDWTATAFEQTEKCKPPGAWAAISGAFPLAPLMGWFAHTAISKDFTTQLGLTPPVDVYLDNPLAGPIDPMYAGWLVRKNPALSSWAIVLLAYTPFSRPDLVVDGKGLQEWEEIKPNSRNGVATGRVKVARITWQYKTTALPYVAGTTYLPPGRVFVTKGRIQRLNLDYEVSLKVGRDMAGLITYEYCISTDWEKVKKIGFALAVSFIVAILVVFVVALSRGRVRPPTGWKPPWELPVPTPVVPIPVPVPVPAPPP